MTSTGFAGRFGLLRGPIAAFAAIALTGVATIALPPTSVVAEQTTPHKIATATAHPHAPKAPTLAHSHR